MDLDAQTLSQAKQLAYRILTYRSRTSRELRDRLQRRGHTVAVIDEVLRQLEAEGYVDDRKFTLNWARYRLQGKPLGRRRLLWELQRHGVSRESLEEVLREIYEEFDEVELAERAARKHLRSRDLPRSAREWQRLARYLLGLGFEDETIAAIFRKLSHEATSLEMSSDNEPD